MRNCARRHNALLGRPTTRRLVSSPNASGRFHVQISPKDAPSGSRVPGHARLARFVPSQRADRVRVAVLFERSSIDQKRVDCAVRSRVRLPEQKTVPKVGFTSRQSHRPRGAAVFSVAQQTHRGRKTFKVSRQRNASSHRIRTTRGFTVTNGRDSGLLSLRWRDTNSTRSRVFQK